MWCSWLLVAAAVVWDLVSLRALTVGVAYLNDSSLHEQMVRVATALLQAGHLPLTSWFPFLGEGSPQFLHYQSLPAILTGRSGVAGRARRGVSLVAVSAVVAVADQRLPVGPRVRCGQAGSGRFGRDGPVPGERHGVGYEQHAYVWAGYGVWTQLWASWTLPLAWGYSWRAIRDGRGYFTSGPVHRADRRAAL